jgi:hypothetical protein
MNISSVGTTYRNYAQFNFAPQRRTPSAVSDPQDESTVIPPVDEADASGSLNPVTEEDQQKIEKLKERDRKVRAHEAAHMAAGSGITQGGPSYSYTTGPDGHRYAVSGNVQIDTSTVPNNPEATLMKMEQVQRAALAPPDPSGQDHRVAAEAATQATEARRELTKKQSPESTKETDPRVKKYKQSEDQSILKRVFA